MYKTLIGGVMLSLLTLASSSWGSAEEVARLVSSARLWTQKNRPDLARQALQKALSIDPQHVETLRGLGLLELKNHSLQEAAKRLSLLQKIAPHHPATRELSEAYRIATRDKEAMAKVRLLARTGKTAEAIQGLKSLFPQGVPEGELGLEYLRIVSKTEAGKVQARAELQRRSAAQPDHFQTKMALASAWMEQPLSRKKGIQLAATLFKHPDADKERVLKLWKEGILSGGGDESYLPYLTQYLANAPHDTEAKAQLDKLRQAVAERQAKAASAQAEAAQAVAEERARQVAEEAFWGALKEAGTLRDKQHFQAAEMRIRAALKLKPDHPNALTALARVQLDLRQTDQAEKLLKRVLTHSDFNESAVDSYAELLAQQEHFEAIPAFFTEQRNRFPKVWKTLNRLESEALAREAAFLIKQGQSSVALKRLERALVLAPEAPWIRFSLAQSYRRLELPHLAIEVMHEGMRISPVPEMRYATALILSAEEALEEATHVLSWVPANHLTEGMRTLKVRLTQRQHLEEARLLWAAGRKESAEQVLKTAINAARTDPDSFAEMLYQGIEWRLEEGLWAQAKLLLGQLPAAHHSDARFFKTEGDILWGQGLDALLIQKMDSALTRFPTEAGLRFLKIKALERMGQQERAAAELESVLLSLPSDEIETRLAVVRRFTALNRPEEAAATLNALQELQPDLSVLPLEAGRIEQKRGRYAEAARLYRAALAHNGTEATEALAQVEQRRQGHVAVGVEVTSKPGDPGISQLNRTESPLQIRVPVGYQGHAFAHLDAIRLKSGAVPLSSDPATAADYGQVAARTGQSPKAPLEQTASGVMMGAGYETDRLRVDMGTTPTTFPVHYVVGGVRYQESFDRLSTRVELSRRPVTSSLVSFAGGKDPMTGEVWGGVRRTGVNMRLSGDAPWAAWFAEWGYGLLNGENIPTNQEMTARAGAEWILVNEADQRVGITPTLTLWHYELNQRYYTFGHGGYYSPQRYIALGLPIEWTGRTGALSWQMVAKPGYSRSYEDSVPYYPTRADLQAAANSPIHEGGSGGGMGYAFSGAIEYRLAPTWVVGGHVQVERSEGYAPNRAGVYLRYHLKDQTGAVPYPPTPVTPYSRY